MSTPHYVAQKFGDHYVLVRQDLPTHISQSTLLLGGVAAAGLGLLIGGRSRWLLLAAAAGLVGASLKGAMPDVSGSKRTSNGPRGGASHQHDRFGAASGQRPQDAVDEAVMESFPASDPPAI